MADTQNKPTLIDQFRGLFKPKGPGKENTKGQLRGLFENVDPKLDQVKKTVRRDLADLQEQLAEGKQVELAADFKATVLEGFKKDLKELKIYEDDPKYAEYMALFEHRWQKERMARNAERILASSELATMDNFIENLAIMKEMGKTGENLPKIKGDQETEEMRKRAEALGIAIASAKPQKKISSIVRGWMSKMPKGKEYKEGLYAALSFFGLGFVSKMLKRRDQAEELIKKGGEKAAAAGQKAGEAAGKAEEAVKGAATGVTDKLGGGEGEKKGMEAVDPAFRGPAKKGKPRYGPKTDDHHSEIADHRHNAGLLEIATSMPSGSLEKLNKIVDRYEQHKTRYQRIAQMTGVPAMLIYTINVKEGWGFNRYLHNGDPLGKATTHVPKGIFFEKGKWEEAAIHALGGRIGGPVGRKHMYNARRKAGLTADTTNIGRMLAFAERYNGIGARLKNVSQKRKGKDKFFSYYVYGGTTLQTKGRSVADHQFDPESIGKRPGVAAILMAIQYREAGYPQIPAERINTEFSLYDKQGTTAVA